MAGTLSKAHVWGVYAASSSQAQRSGGLCGRWHKAKAVAVGTACQSLGTVRIAEELYASRIPVMAVRRKRQGRWQPRGKA